MGLDPPEPYPVDLQSRALLGNNMVPVVHVGVWVPDEGAAFVGGPIVVIQSGTIRLDHPPQEIIEV